MPGKGIKDLRRARRKHDVRFTVVGAESRGTVRKEVGIRRRLLRGFAATTSNKRAAARALRLVRQLSRPGRIRLRLSDPRYASRERRKLLGHLLEFLESGEPNSLAAIHLLPRGPEWRVKPTELHRLDIPALLQRLRTALNRLGASTADGFVLLALEGEYNPVTDLIHLHVHGFATEGMIKVVAGLRRTRALAHKRAVKIVRRIKSQPKSINYIVKIFWKSVYRKDGQNGRPTRVPEPAHSYILLFLDRYTLSNIVLMMGLRVDAKGSLARSKSVHQ